MVGAMSKISCLNDWYARSEPELFRDVAHHFATEAPTERKGRQGAFYEAVTKEIKGSLAV